MEIKDGFMKILKRAFLGCIIPKDRVRLKEMISKLCGIEPIITDIDANTIQVVLPYTDKELTYTLTIGTAASGYPTSCLLIV